jgi:hypothetical protein
MIKLLLCLRRMFISERQFRGVKSPDYLENMWASLTNPERNEEDNARE